MGEVSVRGRWNGRRDAIALWLLLGILALAAVVRVWGIGAESVWLDEATSVVVADNPPAQIVALTAEDIHPPLYYLLLRGWLVFGRGEAAIRSLSAAAGVLTVAALYALGRRLAGHGAGLLAALLLAVSPLHVFYSQEARMYAWVTLWAVLSSLLMLRALERGGAGAWAGYVLATSLGMYTHYYMGFVVLGQNLFVAWLLARRRLRPAALRGWMIAQVAWLLLFAPWLPIVVRQIQAGGGNWVAQAGGRPGLRMLADTFIAFSIGPTRELFPVWLRRGAYAIYGLGVLAALWAGLRPAGRPARRWSALDQAAFCVLAGGAPLALAWLASQLKPLYALRYLLPLLPAFCLLLALGARGLGRRWAPAGAALTAAMLALSLFGLWNMALTPQKPDWRSATAYLLSQSAPGDVVMPEPYWNAKPLRYYAGDKLNIDDRAPLPATPAGVAQAADAALAGHARLWLVETVGHYGDPGRLLAGYLDTRCAQVQTIAFPGVGRIALYRATSTP